MHLHLIEHNRGIGKSTRSYEVLIGIVGEVVALVVRVEVVAREVLIEIGVGIALVEAVLRETLATGVVLRERSVRRMALTIEALTMTMICKGWVLVSGSRTRSISKPASVTVAIDVAIAVDIAVVVVTTAVPWTVEGSAAIVVVSLLAATVWGRLVRWPLSGRSVILRMLGVVGVHFGSFHIVLGVVLEILE